MVPTQDGTGKHGVVRVASKGIDTDLARTCVEIAGDRNGRIGFDVADSDRRAETPVVGTEDLGLRGNPEGIVRLRRDRDVLAGHGGAC